MVCYCNSPKVFHEAILWDHPFTTRVTYTNIWILYVQVVKGKVKLKTERHVPLSLWMAFFTTLSQPVQHILTLSSTVCKANTILTPRKNNIIIYYPTKKKRQTQFADAASRSIHSFFPFFLFYCSLCSFKGLYTLGGYV